MNLLDGSVSSGLGTIELRRISIKGAEEIPEAQHPIKGRNSRNPRHDLTATGSLERT